MADISIIMALVNLVLTRQSTFGYIAAAVAVRATLMRTPPLTTLEYGTYKTVNMAHIRQSKPDMAHIRQSRPDYGLGEPGADATVHFRLHRRGRCGPETLNPNADAPSDKPQRHI